MVIVEPETTSPTRIPACSIHASVSLRIVQSSIERLLRINNCSLDTFVRILECLRPIRKKPVELSNHLFLEISTTPRLSEHHRRPINRCSRQSQHSQRHKNGATQHTRHIQKRKISRSRPKQNLHLLKIVLDNILQQLRIILPVRIPHIIHAHPDPEKRLLRRPLWELGYIGIAELGDLIDQAQHFRFVWRDERRVDGRTAVCEVVRVEETSIVLLDEISDPVDAAGRCPAWEGGVADWVVGGGERFGDVETRLTV